MSDDTYSPDFGSLGRAAPPWKTKRPLRIAMLGDFGAGASKGRLDTGAALARRKPLNVEFDTLEDAMRRLAVSLTLPLGADGLPVEIDLSDLDGFHPDTVYAGVPLFAELASLRRRLNQPSQFVATAAEVAAWAENAGPCASRLARQATARAGALSRSATLDDFARLTGCPSTSPNGDAVGSLLRRVVGPFVHASPSQDKDALVAAVDAGLSDAMRALLHHPDFQDCESLWRGADFVLRRLETSNQLQVHLFDISAEELAADLSGVDDLCETGLYRLLVDAPAEQADGGYTYVAGCYRFDATPPHAELLGRAAQIASHAGASMLVGINTDPFADRKEPPHPLVRAAFGELRDLPAASFLGLLGPRFLLRHPYGKKSDPISSFAFEEFSRETGLGGMLWGHPALLALTVLARQGAPLTVSDLPFYHYVDQDGDSVALPCTDRMISMNVATLLREQGINAVMAHKGEGLVRLNGLHAVNGDGLAVAGATPRAAPVGKARFGLQAKIDTEVVEDKGSFVPATRRGGAGKNEPVEDSSDEVVEENAVHESADTTEGTARDTDESTADGDVEGGAKADDAKEQDTAPVSSVPDEDLGALLASLEEPAPSSDAEHATEPAMDPDLAELLKSLE